MFTSRHFMTEWAHLWLGGVYTKNVGIWENTFSIDNQDMTYVRSEYFQDRPCKNNIRGKMSHKEMTNLRTVEPQPKPRKSTRYLEMKIYLILGQMETYLDTVPAPGDHQRRGKECFPPKPKAVVLTLPCPTQSPQRLPR